MAQDCGGKVGAGDMWPKIAGVGDMWPKIAGVKLGQETCSPRLRG